MQDTIAARRFCTRISGVYDWLAERDERPARDAGLRLLDPRPGERILDVGFGTGHSLEAIASAVGARGGAFGVDISDGMAATAARRLREAGHAARALVALAAIPPLPYVNACFDAAFAAFTLELFPPRAMADLLSEIARTLKPGGRLVCVSMSVPTGAERDTVIERTYRWLHRRLPHVVDCMPIELAAVLGASGFRVIEERRLAIWSMPVSVSLALAPARGPSVV